MEREPFVKGKKSVSCYIKVTLLTLVAPHTFTPANNPPESLGNTCNLQQFKGYLHFAPIWWVSSKESSKACHRQPSVPGNKIPILETCQTNIYRLAKP